MNVLLLSRYGRMGASSRIRSYQYLPYLRSQGIEITVSALFSDDYVAGLYEGKISPIEVLRSYFNRLGFILKSRRFDLVWVEKEMLPWLPSWFELDLFPSNTPLIVDYDDALFHRYDQHRNTLIRKLMGKKIDSVMRRANLVIVGNSYLGDRAKISGAKHVEWLPTVVDLSRYKINPTKIDKPVTIGWIGSPGTTHYLRLIEDALRKVVLSKNVRIVAIGANKKKLQDLPIVVKPWSEASEVSEIQQFEIGIMPLPDEPFERGKCGYKLIQYMACGKPVIASPIGVNSEIVQIGENGFLSNNTAEWFDALDQLVSNKSLREQLGETGRKHVEQKYSIQQTASKLAKLINEFR